MKTIKEIYAATEHIYWKDIPSELQERVIEKEREFILDSDFQFDSECILEDWKERLERMGFEDVEISYSGFWSQGDGASFTCKNINLEKVLSDALYCGTKYNSTLWYFAVWVEKFYIYADVVRHNTHYCHENTIHVNVEDSENVLSQSNFTWLEDYLTVLVQKLCKRIYSDLETDYTCMMSDEYIISSLVEKETDLSHHFTLDGEFIS